MLLKENTCKRDNICTAIYALKREENEFINIECKVRWISCFMTCWECWWSNMTVINLCIKEYKQL